MKGKQPVSAILFRESLHNMDYGERQEYYFSWDL